MEQQLVEEIPMDTNSGDHITNSSLFISTDDTSNCSSSHHDDKEVSDEEIMTSPVTNNNDIENTVQEPDYNANQNINHIHSNNHDDENTTSHSDYSNDSNSDNVSDSDSNSDSNSDSDSDNSTRKKVKFLISTLRYVIRKFGILEKFLLNFIFISYYSITFFFALFLSSFSYVIPTRELYWISVILLGVHLSILQIINYLPHFLWNIFQLCGAQDAYRELQFFYYFHIQPQLFSILNENIHHRMNSSNKSYNTFESPQHQKSFSDFYFSSLSSSSSSRTYSAHVQNHESSLTAFFQQLHHLLENTLHAFVGNVVAFSTRKYHIHNYHNQHLHHPRDRSNNAHVDDTIFHSLLQTKSSWNNNNNSNYNHYSIDINNDNTNFYSSMAFFILPPSKDDITSFLHDKPTFLSSNRNYDSQQIYLYPPSSQLMSTIFTFLKSPLASIVLPVMILSIFLLTVMTLFLLMHILFQGFIYITSYQNYRNTPHSNNNNNNNIRDNHNYPYSNTFTSFTLWAVLVILLLETLLPWLCFAIGIYVSISFHTGPFVSLGTVALTFLPIWAIRKLRMGIYTNLQGEDSAEPPHNNFNSATVATTINNTTGMDTT